MGQLILQPNEAASKDSYINSSVPTTNFGSDVTMIIGHTTKTPASRRALIDWDLSSIPAGSKILSTSKLEMNVISGITNGADYEIHRITQSLWTEAGVTWDKYDGTNNWTTPGGDINSPIVPYAGPVATGNFIITGDALTAFLQDALDNRTGIARMLLKHKLENITESYAVDSAGGATKPKLTIVFETMAFPLTKMINEINFAEASGGVTLPEGTKGMFIKIKNNYLSDVDVFPTTTGHIDKLGADRAYVLPFGNSEVFNCYKTNRWLSQSNGIYYVEKRIESADVQNLQSLPVEFIPAPPAGKLIIIEQIPTVENVFNGVVYPDTDSDGKGAVQLIYDTATKQLYEHITVLLATVSQNYLMTPIAADPATDSQMFAGKSVKITSIQDVATGDSPIIIRAFYSIRDASSIQNHFSLDFNGTTQYLTVPDAANLSFGDASTDNPFSITAWINMDDATNFRIIEKRGATNMEWELTISPLDQLEFFLFDLNVSIRIAKRSVSTFTTDQGSWIHIAATYDGSGNVGGIKLYRNAVELSTVSASAGVYVAMHNTSEIVNIGALVSLSLFADGKIDELKIVNKELSAAEILEDYNNGKVPPRGILSFNENFISVWAMGDGATFGGGVWPIPDERGSNDATSVAMIASNRVDDIP